MMRFGAACVLVLALCGIAPASADTMAKIDRAYPVAPPDYPDSAQLQGEQGDVLVEVRVDSSGRPRGFRLKQSSGFNDLDNSAIASAMSWHYVPAVIDGDTSTSWMTVRIHFGPEQMPAPSPAPAGK